MNENIFKLIDGPIGYFFDGSPLHGASCFQQANAFFEGQLSEIWTPAIILCISPPFSAYCGSAAAAHKFFEDAGHKME